MSELALVAVTAKSTLQELAKQATTLGVGLEHAAPRAQFGVANNAVQYLLEIGKVMQEAATACESFLPPPPSS